MQTHYMWVKSWFKMLTIVCNDISYNIIVVAGVRSHCKCTFKDNAWIIQTESDKATTIQHTFKHKIRQIRYNEL